LKWLLRLVGLGSVSPLALLAGAVALISVLGGLYWMIDGAGYSRAKDECNAAALQAKLDEKIAEIETLNGRLKRNADTIAGLVKGDADARDRIAQLEVELSKRPLQSTKPGAKQDASALLDDRCNLTPSGAARGMRYRKPKS
jgi:hypothetical protein